MGAIVILRRLFQRLFKNHEARGILETTVTVAEPITAGVETSVQAKLRETGKDMLFYLCAKIHQLWVVSLSK